MIGAILGDVIGSPYEFDRGNKTKDFPLFTWESKFTDDSVMTVAVADALLKSGKDADVDVIKDNLVKSMIMWGHRYPYAGYGARFIGWLMGGVEKAKPYGSWGNGSAMRVSAAGWLYETLERTREVARATAEVSHNHLEGIKGAEATASIIFMARNGKSKEEIKEYIIKEFGYDLSRTLDEIRPGYHHVEDCMHTVPEAITAFLEGTSYEDVVRNAVSLGGDTDTLGAIAGAMAEAYYGIPKELITECYKSIPENMASIVDNYRVIVNNNWIITVDSNEEDDENKDNILIKKTIENMLNERTRESFFAFTDTLIKRLNDNGCAIMPYIDVNNCLDELDIDDMKVGNNISFSKDLRLRMDTMTDPEGKQWIPFFTSEVEINNGVTPAIRMNTPIERILRAGLGDGVEGVVINPFGLPYTMEKHLIEGILTMAKEIKEEG